MSAPKTKRIVCLCHNFIETDRNRTMREKLQLRKHRMNKLGQWVCLTCGHIKPAASLQHAIAPRAPRTARGASWCDCQMEERMPYRTRNGRREQLPSFSTNGVQTAIKVDGTIVSFRCKRGGHITRKDFAKGPKPKRMDARTVARMARYWGFENPTNYCYGWCHQCQNEHDEV